MKKIAVNSSLLLLTAVFLLSALGISLNKMRCLESGKIVYSITEAEDCCPGNENPGNSLDVQCCEFSKIVFQSSVAEILKQETDTKIPFSKSHYTVILQWMFLSPDKVITTVFTDTSPPVPAGDYLSLISVFRI